MDRYLGWHTTLSRTSTQGQAWTSIRDRSTARGCTTSTRRSCTTGWFSTRGSFCHMLKFTSYVYFGLFKSSRKIQFGVSEPNYSLHSHLYIYRQLKSQRTSLYLQNSRVEVRSKFGRELDERLNILMCGSSGRLFSKGRQKINGGT